MEGLWLGVTCGILLAVLLAVSGVSRETGKVDSELDLEERLQPYFCPF